MQMGRAVTVSIVHVGLPLDHPSIPLEERAELTKRLSDLQERMRTAGYDYKILHASPECGLDAFKRQLRSRPCDGVMIGGGVVGDPDLKSFMEQIIDTTREAAPRAKIMLHDHAEDVRVTVERRLKSRS
jgi:hypothetical protein